MCGLGVVLNVAVVSMSISLHITRLHALLSQWVVSQFAHLVSVLCIMGSHTTKGTNTIFYTGNTVYFQEISCILQEITYMYIFQVFLSLSFCELHISAIWLHHICDTVSSFDTPTQYNTNPLCNIHLLLVSLQRVRTWMQPSSLTATNDIHWISLILGPVTVINAKCTVRWSEWMCCIPIPIWTNKRT